MNGDFFIIFSVILLISALLMFNKAKPSKITAGVFFVMVLSSIVLLVAYGVATYFTGNGIDEATVYHLKYGLDGAGFLEYSWLIAITLMVLLLGVFYLFWFVLKRKNNKKTHVIYSISSIFLLSFSLLLNPASIDIYNLQTGSSVITEQSSTKKTSSFYEHYRKPYIEASENSHKNIVFIYAESLERTYFDKTIFPDLIKGLYELESKSTYFTNIKQVRGTGWTIGGMTASQCGIPLFTPSHGNSMSGMDLFLSSAVCLGDLLKDKGYQLNYMGGGSLNFAGKGKLYSTHGFTDVLGRKELLPKLENQEYKTAWGLYDDSLLDMVYERFIELSELGDKFGLFTLTLDTHHPKGHPSKSCKGIEYKDASNPILNAVACSDYLISNFINKIIESPFADNTVVVLVSDHLSMRNTAYDLLKTADRRNLFMILDADKQNPVEIKTAGSMLDIGSTLLPFLGFTGDLGLGRNLLDEQALEKNRLFIHSNLKKWKSPISEFWGFPRIQERFKINVDNKTIRIDNRAFKMPILVELNDKLESTLKFQFNSGRQTLVEHRKKIEKNNYFLLVDECKNIMDKSLGEKGFCFLSGQGKEYTKRMKLNKNITYTVGEIQQLLEIP